VRHHFFFGGATSCLILDIPFFVDRESVFKGWQLLCVLLITFPPSKNFETYLCSFMQQRMAQVEGRVDVMARYCIRKLASISRKGPRGKPPSLAEIETASVSVPLPLVATVMAHRNGIGRGI
jgi:hypothetical protein